MSLESYRNEAFGFNETPATHREIILPRIEVQGGLDKVRRLITAIDLEMNEQIPNIEAINLWANMIIEIMKELINDK